MQTKVCKTCNNEYPATAEFFHKDSTGKYGLKANCKLCINGDKYKITSDGNHLCKSCNRELPFTEEYFVINWKSGNLVSPCRECRGLKFGKIKHRKKRNSDNYIIPTIKKCKSCNTVYNNTTKYFYKNTHYKDNLSIICKECKNINDIRVLKIKTKNAINRRRNNIQVKLAANIRSRIRMALKNNSKKGKSISLLGCSILEYKQYLEDRMSKSMNWNNYGKIWQIDHIIPCYKFDLSIEKNQYKCFNYTNTQPMFSSDNNAKTDSFYVIYKSSKLHEKIKNYNFNLKIIIDDR